MINVIQGTYEKAKEYYQTVMFEDYFEFCFAYTPTNQIFRELDRFIWESRHQMTRFKNRYAGPVLVDLTEWNAKHTNEYFEAFLYYLKDQPSLVCTFMIQNRCETWLLNLLKDFFEIDVIELETYADKEKKRRIGFCVEDGGVTCVRS